MTDPFSLPLEWIPEENRLLVDAIRTWADEEVIPVRRRIDEDWDHHECIGVRRNIYELLRDWCDTRVVAGKPLKEHTITAAVLADIVVAIETSRADTYLKARMLDRPDIYGPRHTAEMLARTRVTKLYVSDQLTAVANKAMDLMGSHGYAREGDLEKHWRDSKILSLWMGGRALPQLDIARWYFDAHSY